MQPKKTPKKPGKVAKISTPTPEATIAEVKPVKRAASPKSPAPKTTSHRHSKVTVPATPAVEEVMVDVVVAPTPINKEEVARLAYRFWEERNYVHGHAEEDWLRAVKTLSAKA